MENTEEFLISAKIAPEELRKLPKKDNKINTLEDIMGDLGDLTEGFPKAALQAAIKKPKELIPLLLNILNETAEFYQSLEGHEMGHLYAMFLLAQFREKTAFPLIMKLASLPKDEDAVDIIFDDVITEDLHRIIASVYDGDLAAVKKLIENPIINIWSRNAGIKSLLVLVKEKTLERGEVINYFKELFNHPAFVNDEMAMTQLVNAACDLYPEELYNEIKSAFKSGMVDSFSVDMKWVDSLLAMGQEKALQKYLADHYGFIYDTIQEMQWWVCFREKETKKSEDKLQFDELKHQLFNSMPDSPREKPPKIGRNEPCPCGSNKKFKKCCLHSTL